MQLFTIHYDRLTLVSIFDSSGQFAGSSEERIRVSIHDLPASTVAMYRQKMTGLNFEATLQDRVSSEPRRNWSDHTRGMKKGELTVVAYSNSPGKSSAQTALQRAAATGDLTAAINKR